MRGFLIVLAMLAAGPAAAETVPPEPGIEGVISSQIEDFRADDFVDAFRFASPGIQRLFGTPERFGEMVREGYPMVWRPGGVKFLDLRQEDGVLWQRVFVRGPSGRPFVLDYRMVRDESGGWRIDGVQVLEAPEVGA